MEQQTLQIYIYFFASLQTIGLNEKIMFYQLCFIYFIQYMHVINIFFPITRKYTYVTTPLKMAILDLPKDGKELHLY